MSEMSIAGIVTMLTLIALAFVLFSTRNRQEPNCRDPKQYRPPNYGYQPKERDLAPLLVPGAIPISEHATFVRMRRALNDPRNYKEELEKLQLEYHELKSKLDALKSTTLEWYSDCERYAHALREDPVSDDCKHCAEGVEYSLASFDRLIGKGSLR